MDWIPEVYAAFLSFLLRSVVREPHAIIAAGHAAGYVLKHAAGAPQVAPRLVLVAPTRRGPLPTVMGKHRPFFDRLCRIVDRPVSGRSSTGSTSIRSLCVVWVPATSMLIPPIWWESAPHPPGSAGRQVRNSLDYLVSAREQRVRHG
jgi:hypothetical protein